VLSPEPFVDIHCHLLPGIDDGARHCEESLAMARMAVADGIGIVLATPHQLGSYSHNDGPTIRRAVDELQRLLDERQIPLRVAPGADVRIEPDLVARLRRGDVVSLGDTGRYVLLELPHEIYFPLDRMLAELAAAGYVGILSHPERNHGILASPEVLPPLVAQSCLLQITAGSLLGAFGRRSQIFCERLLERGLVHFVSTDAHGVQGRRPQLREAFDRVVALAGAETALALFCRNPARVVAGCPILPASEVVRGGRSPDGWWGWLTGKKAA
jgi:protein-tyrosine phosphatase